MIIAIEGIDGAGKSTLINELANFFQNFGEETAILRWTSFFEDEDNKASTPFELAKHLKVTREIGPLSFALWHCADFAYRWETIAKPAIEAGKVVLCDRFKYSGYVRSVGRGVEEGYILSLYQYTPEPDIVFYLDIDPILTLERKITTIGKPGYYESGNDIFPYLDRKNSFLKFQKDCKEKYLKYLPFENTYIIDATKSRDVVASIAVDHVKNILTRMAV